VINEGLGLRQHADRRQVERRANTRGTSDRRRGDRRRRRLRTLLFAVATTVFAPHYATTALKPLVEASIDHARTVPRVTFSMDFKLPPHLAYESLIQEAATVYRLDPALIRAVIRIESAFDPLAVSRVGAQGLMQLMPSLAAEMGVIDSFDPRDNIMGGVRYLSELLDRHHGHVDLALASYNAGPGAVDHYRAVPPFRETRRYVKVITGLVARAHADSESD
jgi:soluble lytic murein transglycosylase-like protein